MDATAPSRSHYAGAWAVLLGALLMLAFGSVGALAKHANVDALLGLWFGFVALQLLIFVALGVVEYRRQRAHWSMAIPVTIVIAQVVAGLSAVVAGRSSDSPQASYADVLF